MKIIICVGVCASGKSTWAANYVRNNPNTIILCADDFRKYYCGDESDQTKNGLIFKSLFSFAEMLLSQGFNLVISNTNIDKKARKSWVEIGKKRMCRIEAVEFIAPLSICIERDKKRSRIVGEKVITNMHDRLERPRTEEGFDKITIVE